MSTEKKDTPSAELPQKLRTLLKEMGEVASGAEMGAALLRENASHIDAARFLDGVAAGIRRVSDRVKGELDWDEIPF